MVAGHQSTGEGRRRGGTALPASVPEGRRVYAVGDIHGRADLLRRLHRLILDDAADGPGLHRVVVYVGDYVDRGPDPFGVAEMLITEPLEGFERHHLKGNHEDFMLRFLEDGTGGESWLMNGGISTLESYGVGLWDILAGQGGILGGMDSIRDALTGALPESHRHFYAGLEATHAEGGYLFVHAGIRPGVPLEKQSVHDLMWIREPFLDSDADFGHVVVHGHTVHAEPEVHANRIAIDTGAWYSNHLTALVLEAGTRRFLRT